MKSCKALLAHTEEDLVEAMQRDKKELRDKIESESSDVKRKMELECNEMRDRLQSEKKAASVAMEEEVEERKRDINQIRQTVSEEWGVSVHPHMSPQGTTREVPLVPAKHPLSNKSFKGATSAGIQFATLPCVKSLLFAKSFALLDPFKVLCRTEFKSK